VIDPPPRRQTKRSSTAPSARQSARRGARQGVPIGLGDRVSHQKYGLGRVVAVRPGSDGPVAGIDFGDGKVREMHLIRETQLMKL
jgi:DNA helicase II / ATP-dependent DNA helicase PcrA